MSFKALLLIAFAGLLSSASGKRSGGKRGGRMGGSVYEGYWACPDIDDGSTWKLQVFPSFDKKGYYRIRAVDSYWSSCESSPGVSRRGVEEGEAMVREDGALYIEGSTLTCFPSPEIYDEETVHFDPYTYIYDPKRGVITTEGARGTIVCHKLNTH